LKLFPDFLSSTCLRALRADLSDDRPDLGPQLVRRHLRRQVGLELGDLLLLLLDEIRPGARAELLYRITAPLDEGLDHRHHAGVVQCVCPRLDLLVLDGALDRPQHRRSDLVPAAHRLLQVGVDPLLEAGHGRLLR